MKVGFVTDIHVKDSDLLHQIPTMKIVSERMKAEGVELVLVGGDLAGITVPHRASPKERNALVEFFLDLASFARVIVVRGNHDFPGDYDVLNHLAVERGGRIHRPISFVSEPTIVGSGDEWDVVVLPWLDRSRFAAHEDYRESVLSCYRGLSSERSSAHRFILGHAAIVGAMIREGQPMVPTEDPTFSVDEIAQGFNADAAFFGHYHLPQNLDGSIPAFYGGSLFVHQYGEDFEKGFLVWDTEAKSEKRISIPQTPKLVVDVLVSDGKLKTSVRPGGARFTLKAISGSLVKVVVKVRQEERAESTPLIDELVRKIERKAHGVRVNYQVAKSTRSRDGAEKIAGLPTVEKKVLAYFDALEDKPEQSRIDRAVSMLRRVEKEVDK